jgi:hypothetical protein
VWRWTCVSMHEAGTRHFRPRLVSWVLILPSPTCALGSYFVSVTRGGGSERGSDATDR